MGMCRINKVGRGWGSMNPSVMGGGAEMDMYNERTDDDGTNLNGCV